VQQKAATERNKKILCVFCAVFERKKAFDYFKWGYNVEQQTCAEFCGFFGEKSEFVRNKADNNYDIQDGNLLGRNHHVVQKHLH
jgi:hypothetical protein